MDGSSHSKIKNSDIGQGWILFRRHEIPNYLRKATDVLEPARPVFFLKCDPEPTDGKKYRLLYGHWYVNPDPTGDLNPPTDTYPTNGNGTHGTPRADMVVPVNLGKEFARAIKDFAKTGEEMPRMQYYGNFNEKLERNSHFRPTETIPLAPNKVPSDGGYERCPHGGMNTEWFHSCSLCNSQLAVPEVAVKEDAA